MKFKMLAILVITALVLPLKPIRGQPAGIDDVALWTVQRVIRDAHENKKLKAKIKYSESSLEEEYDSKNNLRSKKNRSKTIDGDGKSQVAGFEIDLYNILADTYNFKLADTGNTAGLTVIDDKVYVVIDFSPKPGLVYKNLTDRFIQRLEGRMFIDVQGEHYYIYKLEARIPQEFSFTYWWVFIPVPITIKSFGFTLIQERIDLESIIAEKHIEAMIAFDSMRDGRKEFRYDYSNFQYKK